MKIKNTLFILIALSFSAIHLTAQSFAGIWKTVDDKTNEARSHVEIYEQDGKLYGKLIRLLTPPPKDICDKCTGSKKNKPLLGLIIVEGLKKVKDYWTKGTIMDPENGKEYGCSIWFEAGKPDELKVRGKHWTGIYRTQTWYKVK
ncbi:MAG: hypothetical protein ACI8P3_000101 [Saprospiraceae bacterium]|jgi:uncharacterized protein (DUF2147 family)